MFNILKAYPPAEVRKYRQQGDHLPAFGHRVEIENERVEMVGRIAKADIHIMLHLAGLEREHVSEVKSEDCRHMVVVNARKVICCPFRSRNMHRISLSGAVLPMTALQTHCSAEAFPLCYGVQHMSPIETHRPH